MEYEMEEKDEVQCAIETLLKAEEIKKDAALMEKVKAKTKENSDTIMSIAGLRKRAKAVRESAAKESSEARKSSPDPELRTEEDKAAIQEDEAVDGKLKEMGLKPKKES